MFIKPFLDDYVIYQLILDGRYTVKAPSADESTDEGKLQWDAYDQAVLRAKLQFRQNLESETCMAAHPKANLVWELAERLAPRHYEGILAVYLDLLRLLD